MVRLGLCEGQNALSAATPEQRKVYDEEVSDTLRAIESKQGDIYELWQLTREWSLVLFRNIYRYLGIKFDVYFFESEVSEESQTIVDEYLSKGVFTVSEGAVGCDLSAEKLGFMLVRKRDGNTLLRYERSSVGTPQIFRLSN